MSGFDDMQIPGWPWATCVWGGLSVAAFYVSQKSWPVVNQGGAW